MRMVGIVTGAKAELLRLGNRGAMGYLYAHAHPHFPRLNEFQKT